jgi:hypothetical protein
VGRWLGRFGRRGLDGDRSFRFGRDRSRGRRLWFDVGFGSRKGCTLCNARGLLDDEPPD